MLALIIPYQHKGSRERETRETHPTNTVANRLLSINEGQSVFITML